MDKRKTREERQEEHVALYRKYRPHTFKDVVGQDQVVAALEGAIKAKKIGHAYLFAGSRGTGKTSVARIFAREIGCDEKDLYEIDAASNRGIDDVRELREAVHTLPFVSPYKVYIIDEAHMLTKEAFNALLKTLEEPPAHAVFILATTEMAKLPDTVVSRCEVHQFKKPTVEMLRDILLMIAKKEGYTLESSAADLIALLGEGSFRDTEGLLQKVFTITPAKGKITREHVEQVSGAPTSELLNAVLMALEEGNAEQGLMTLRAGAEKNIDAKVFAKLILHRLRAILLLRFAKDMAGQIEAEFSEEDFAVLTKIARNKDSRVNSHTLVAFLEAYDQIAWSAIPQLPLELAVIQLVGE